MSPYLLLADHAAWRRFLHGRLEVKLRPYLNPSLCLQEWLAPLPNSAIARCLTVDPTETIANLTIALVREEAKRNLVETMPKEVAGLDDFRDARTVRRDVEAEILGAAA